MEICDGEAFRVFDWGGNGLIPAAELLCLLPKADEPRRLTL